MQTVLYKMSQRFEEKKFSLEKEFEKLIIENSKNLFGKNTMIIDAKKKLDTQFLGGTIPDCFLFDLSDIDNPEFYIVEVELSKHSFFNHIFPQITKFFAFFKNKKSQSELIEKLYSIIISDKNICEEFRRKIGNKEIFLYIKEMVENSQNILLIIDNEKKELPEIIETYSDTWGKIVKLAIVKEYSNNNNESILSISPDFENIETVDITENCEENNDLLNYSEEYHLDGVKSEVKEIYNEIKKKLSLENEKINYNPQRYYISLRKKRNFAYIKIRKSKILIVVMLHINEVEKKIKEHKIKELSVGIQKFYNGDCCQILIESNKNLEEITSLLLEIQK